MTNNEILNFLEIKPKNEEEAQTLDRVIVKAQTDMCEKIIDLLHNGHTITLSLNNSAVTFLKIDLDKFAAGKKQLFVATKRTQYRWS